MPRCCVVYLVSAVIATELAMLSAVATGEQPPLQVTAGRDAPTQWPACMTDGRRLRRSADERFQYAVVVDAGSSGSRVRVYRWPTPAGSARVALQAPGVQQIHSLKITPGLSTHTRAGDLEQVGDNVQLLLNNATGHVPRRQRHTSPVYIMATAGMRLLEEGMDAVVEHIDSLMRNSSFQPFLYASSHNTRILSGEEEGVFAWIAVNYLNGVFSSQQQSHGDLAGILEMGGASTQIAFAPEGDILAAKFPVLIGGRRYPLYVHSYLYYGQNAIDTRIKRRLMADIDSGSAPPDPTQPVDHPCLLRGDTVPDSKLNRTFTGSSDPSACLRILNEIVQKADPSRCYPKPCGIGVFYQPTIDQDIVFYAVGSFRYPLENIGAVQNEVFVPRLGFEKAVEFCSKNFSDVLPPTVTSTIRSHTSSRCMMALYTSTLFTRGYGLSNDTRQIRAVKTINGQPLDWSLGAVLYEDELAAINRCTGVGDSPRTGQVIDNGAAAVTSSITKFTLAACLYTALSSVIRPL